MAAAKSIIVTAADEKYGSLVLELIQSLAPHRGRLDVDIGCLDLGLSPDTASRLTSAGVTLRNPEWQFRPHEKFSTDRKNLSRAARPFLRDLFQGYAVYVWIDADAWIQHPIGLQWLILASRWADIAAVPTVHRSYKLSPIDVQWLYRRYMMAFGEETAKRLMAQPYLNAGVYALPARSPVWQQYIQRFQDCLERWDGEFLSDQAVLNAVVQLDNPKYEQLPAKVNWICHLARPRWDQTNGVLVEPAMPFEQISIVHNTFNDKSIAIDIKALNGATVNTNMSFSAIQSLRAQSPQPQRLGA
jgi:lipopolysaccharide biosynthesis glycosyltransferase